MQRTGKTTFVIDIIKRLYKKKRCISILKDDMEEAYYDSMFTKLDLSKQTDIDKLSTAKNGAFVILWEKKETFPILLKLATEKKLTNWVLNLDDANTYYHPVPEDSLKDLSRRRRQYSVDVFASSHGWSQVPVFLFDYVTHYSLFATKEKSIYSREDLITNFEEVKAVGDYVNMQHRIGKTHTKIIIDQFGTPN